MCPSNRYMEEAHIDAATYQMVKISDLLAQTSKGLEHVHRASWTCNFFTLQRKLCSYRAPHKPMLTPYFSQMSNGASFFLTEDPSLSSPEGQSVDSILVVR